jgi:FAD/FMN-containing dehydrogenase
VIIAGNPGAAIPATPRGALTEAADGSDCVADESDLVLVAVRRRDAVPALDPPHPTIIVAATTMPISEALRDQRVMARLSHAERKRSVYAP